MASTLQTGDQFIVSRNNSTYKTTIDDIKEFIGSGGSEVIVSETAPDPADYPAGTGGVLTEGTLWWDSTEGDLFVLYDDGGSLIWVDATNHSNSDDRDVIISENEPVADFIGQLWVDTSECPPTLNVWDGDCDGGGGSWVPIEGGSSAGLVQLGVAIISSGDPDNYVGSVLTATGGEGISSAGVVIDPVYSWTRDGIGIPSVRGTTVTADVAGTYEVTATVVDSNTGETSSKTADILISVLPGVINQPTVLAPSDGAGGGAKRYLISDTIIEVEGGGISTCETELIQNVDPLNLPNYDWKAVDRNNRDSLNTIDWGTTTFSFENVDQEYGDLLSTAIGFGFLVVKYDSPEFFAFGGPAGGRLPNDDTELDNQIKAIGYWKSETGSAGSWEFDSWHWHIGNTSKVSTGKSTYWLMCKYDEADKTPPQKEAWVTDLNAPYGDISDGNFWYLTTEGVSSTILTFPSDQGFDCFADGDVVQEGTGSITTQKLSYEVKAVASASDLIG